VLSNQTIPHLLFPFRLQWIDQHPRLSSTTPTFSLRWIWIFEWMLSKGRKRAIPAERLPFSHHHHRFLLHLAEHGLERFKIPCMNNGESVCTFCSIASVLNPLNSLLKSEIGPPVIGGWRLVFKKLPFREWYQLFYGDDTLLGPTQQIRSLPLCVMHRRDKSSNKASSRMLKMNFFSIRRFQGLIHWFSHPQEQVVSGSA